MSHNKIALIPGFLGLLITSQASALTYISDWSGNDWYGGPDSSGEHQYVHGCAMQMYVAGNGDIYQGSTSAGDHGPACMYPSDASYVRDLVDGESTGSTYKSYLQGVTADDTYYYVSILVNYKSYKSGALNANGLPEIPPNSETRWYSVGRYFRSNQQPAPFPKGYGTLGNLLVIQETPKSLGERSPFITGLAANGNYLYVADAYSGKIKRYSSSSLDSNQFSSWNFANGSDLALDRSGNVYALAEGAGGVLKRYDAGGNQLGSISYGSNQVPMAIAIDRSGSSDKLLVAMDDVRQIWRYTAGLSKETWTLGDAGGIQPGQTPSSSKFLNIKGVGADTNGNIYVAEYGPEGTADTFGNTRNMTRLQKFTSGGSRIWKREAHGWLESPGFSQQQDGVMYTTTGKYLLDYSKMTGSGNAWSWKGTTFDPTKYPDDPRAHMEQYGADIVVLDGVEFMTTFAGPQRGLGVYRFANGVAVPTAIICPNSGGYGYVSGNPSQAWVWSDADADGRIDSGEFSGGTWKESSIEKSFLDSAGDFWAIGTNTIYRIPFAGLSANNIPRWDIANTQIVATSSLPNKPSTLQAVQEGFYDASTDSMYLGVFTSRNPVKAIGVIRFQEIWKYKNWSTSGRTLDWAVELTLPWGGEGGPHDLEIAGDYIFVGETASGDDGSAFDEQQVRVFKASDGSYVETLLPPSDDDHLDYDRSRAIRAHQRPDGSYIVGTESFRTQKTQLFYIPVTSNTYKIIRSGSSLELAVAEEAQNNANVIIENVSSQNDQEWEMITAGTNLYYLKNYLSGQYLNVAGSVGEDGANVSQWPGYGGENYQVAFINPEVVNGETFYNIQFQHNNGIYYLATAGNTSGSNVQASTGQSSEKAKWRIENRAGGRVALVRKGNSRYLALAGDTQNGGNIVAESGSSSEDHLWIKESFEGEWFRLKNKKSGLYLNAAAANSFNGANVALWSASTEPHYQLRTVANGSTVNLEFRHAPGQFLSTTGSSAGTNVGTDADRTRDNAKWSLLPY